MAAQAAALQRLHPGPRRQAGRHTASQARRGKRREERNTHKISKCLNKYNKETTMSQRSGQLMLNFCPSGTVVVTETEGAGTLLPGFVYARLGAQWGVWVVFMQHSSSQIREGPDFINADLTPGDRSKPLILQNPPPSPAPTNLLSPH